VSASPGHAAPSLDPPQFDPDVRFDELYRSAGTAVLGYALNRCASREDALDVTAETFLVAWRRRTEMPNGPEDARAWLFGVARGCLANTARGDRRAQRLGQRLAENLDIDALPDPARIHESRADTRKVRQALDALPAEDRELVTLTAWEGLSPTEAGAVLGLTPGAGWSPQGDAAGTATVDGTTAELRRGNGFAYLIWRRPDGQWVRILGEDAYAETTALIAGAESLVDRPQPIGLQFGLAPAGWSLSGYEDSRSLDLTNYTGPEQTLRLSLIGGEGGATVDSVLADGEPVTGQVTPVTIQGQEGRLVLADGQSGPDFWKVAGQLPDGQMFLLLAPQALTQEQVVQIADEVTYTP
jgi:RNA polymerase sigma factor (sigma-70 family)